MDLRPRIYYNAEQKAVPILLKNSKKMRVGLSVECQCNLNPFQYLIGKLTSSTVGRDR